MLDIVSKEANEEATHHGQQPRAGPPGGVPEDHPQEPGDRRRGDQDLGRDRPVPHPEAPERARAARRQAAQARGGRGQRLRLRRAAAPQPAEVRRGSSEGDRRPARHEQGQGPRGQVSPRRTRNAAAPQSPVLPRRRVRVAPPQVGLVAVGGMTPAGGWDISKPEPKSGGCVQLVTRLKSTVPPENSAPAKSTGPLENSAREKLTVPPENSAAWKKTRPPEVSAPVNSGLSPVNLERKNWTSAPENSA